MVTDNQRREVAQRLRKQAAYCDGSLSEWWQRLQDTVTGEIDFADPKKTFEATADLNDRPTCYLKLPDTETHGNAKVRIYECSECGRTCEEIYGKYERCPHCGAEVLDD